MILRGDFMFSKPNSETACGMFTLPHIISLIFCLLLIALAVYLSRKFDEGKIKVGKAAVILLRLGKDL